MDFHGFHRFSWILMVFRGSGGRKFASLKKQPAAPIETFARFQAFHRFSWISLIFIGFRRYGDKGQPGAPIETFARFQAFH